MAELEPKITQTPAQPSELLSLPAHLRGSHHEITLWENDEALHITLTGQEETLNLAILKHGGPHVLFEYGNPTSLDITTVQAIPPDTTAATLPATPEHLTSVEFPPVTLEGYIGRTPTFSREKGTNRAIYKFPVSYRPDAKQWDQVVWYTVYAFDEQAEAFNKRGFAKGKPVQIAGTDHTHMETPKKGGGPKEVKEIHAEEIAPLNRKPKSTLSENS